MELLEHVHVVELLEHDALIVLIVSSQSNLPFYTYFPGKYKYIYILYLGRVLEKLHDYLTQATESVFVFVQLLDVANETLDG